MNLSVKERLGIKLIAPIYGNLDEHILIRQIFEKIEFDILERSIINLRKQPNGDIAWAVDKERPKEVNFTPQEIELLKRWVASLHEQGIIHRDAVDACMKINSL